VLDQHRVLHEVTTFRRDVATDGRHAVVQYGATLEEDLARRDFTVNAIAYHPLRHEWRDPFGGKEDLSAGVLRAVGAPEDRFREDYLRILRGLRFAARFDFTIEPSTWMAAQAAAPGLKQLSAERVRDEWFKGLQTARSLRRFVKLWIEAGAARIWVPELHEGHSALDHLPEPPRHMRDPVLLTALLSGRASTVLRRLRASNAEIDRAVGIERGPQQPASPDQSGVRRWLSAVGASADDLLALSTLRTGQEPAWASAVRDIRQRGDPLSRSDLAVSGSDLQVLGVSGPRIGQVLAGLLDRVLDDPALNSREKLLALARELS
jgi:tRNA nucleotidyltransferase (CCA-adding enzyme)